MNTRLSKTSAAALLAIVLSLNIAPSAFAGPSRAGDDPFGGTRDRIVRFIQSIGGFVAHVSELLGPPKP